MQIEWGHVLIEGGLLTTLGLPTLWASVRTYLAIKEHRLHTHTEDDGYEESRDEKLTVRGIHYSRTMNGDKDRV